VWTLAIGLLTKIPGLAGQFLDWQVKRMNVDLEGFRTATGVDLAAYQTWVGAQVETNRLKLAQNAWWGAKLIILTAGLPASAHFGAMMLDSFTWPYIAREGWWLAVEWHKINSWHVPAPPAPYDTYEWAIVQSFFILMPAMPLVNATVAWLNRRR
jgi:hypothetical protein